MLKWPCKSGVYMIHNAETSKVYIGSAMDMAWRRDDHFRKLRGGYHHNPHLQAAFRLYGQESFEFVPIAFVPKPMNLLPTEQFYIDLYRSSDRHYGYNARPRAESNLGRKCSPETLEKMRRANLGKKQSPETIAKRVAARGKVMLSDEHKKALLASKVGKPRPDVREWAPELFSKLTREAVLLMRADRAAGMTLRALGEKYSCNESTAHNAVNGKGAFYASI